MKKETKLAKIEEQLSMLPEGKLDEVIDFIGFILSKKDSNHKKIYNYRVFGLEKDLKKLI